MDNNDLILIGGSAALLAIAYFLTKKTNATPQYTYQIYIDPIDNKTKALNLETNNIDFEGDPKTVIESATSIGKTLIKSGTYETYNVNLPSGTYLSGESINTILKCPNNTQENVMHSFNKDNITIRKISIDGNRFNNTRQSNTAKQNGMYFSGCIGLDIENCYVYRTIESGIQVTGRDGTPSSNIKILNNTINDTWAEGIVAFDNVSNITIQGNTSSRNGELANGGYSGITIMRNISNANIQYNTTFLNTIDGIAIDGDPGFENKNINVQNNISYSNIMSGIAFHDTIDSNILTNQCYNNHVAGIWIADNSSYIDVDYNDIYDNTEFGMNILNSSNITLQNLHVKNTEKWDCINADTCTNIKIITSEIEGANGFGTRLKNCTNCTIDKNNYHHNKKINIDLDSSNYNTITNNESHHSNEDGIALDFNSTNNLIQYNKAYDNLHFGIATDTVHLPHLGKNTIDSNQVYNNGWDGIIVIRGDYNIISYNKIHDNTLCGILIEGRIQSEGTNPDGRSNYTDVLNNECWNNKVGILIQGNSSNNIIRNCQVNHCVEDGIKLGGIIASDLISQNTIDNCHIENVGGSGIGIYKRNSAQVKNNNITNNVIITTGNHGIVATGTDYTYIFKNNVNNAGANYISGFSHGIAVDGNEDKDASTGCIVDNNTVINSHEAGIEIADGIYNCDVTNNNVDITLGPRGSYGIYYGGGFAPSFNGKISNNTVKNTNGNGIEINAPNFLNTNTSKNITVENNTTESNKLHGILLNNCEQITCKNNTSKNNDKGNTDNDGIRIGSCRDVSVNNNTSYDDQTVKTQNYAIAVYSGTDVITNIMIENNNVGNCQFGRISLGTVGIGSTVTIRNNIDI